MDKFEEEYFKDRKFENKYYYMALDWIKYLKPKNAYDCGCGNGYFVHAFNYLGVPCEGYDISKYAVKNAYEMSIGKISNTISNKTYDLVYASDVIEHIPKSEEKVFIDNLCKLSDNYILCSICDITLKDKYVDETHCNLMPRSYWIYQFEKRGFKSLEVPKSWKFYSQLYLFKKDNTCIKK